MRATICLKKFMQNDGNELWPIYWFEVLTFDSSIVSWSEVNCRNWQFYSYCYRNWLGHRSHVEWVFFCSILLLTHWLEFSSRLKLVCFFLFKKFLLYNYDYLFPSRCVLQTEHFLKLLCRPMCWCLWAYSFLTVLSLSTEINASGTMLDLFK